MKMKKILLGSFLCLTVSFSAIAQSNPGAGYLMLGETELAKQYFMKTMRQMPADSYYYLGEIAYQAGNLAEAKSNYEKGLAANPESALNAVGLAKLELKTNPKEATKTLNEIQKKNKKDVEVILAIADAFEKNGIPEEAEKKLNDARKADKKSPWIYVYEGDLLVAKNQPGPAAQSYDQAIYSDPKCIIAYLKGAAVYESINYETALSLLNKAVEIDPTYRLTYKYIGKIANQKGHYDQSIEAYKKYFEMGEEYSMDDLTRYASSNFFKGNYDPAINLIEKGLTQDPDNFVLNRLMMYSLNAIEDYGSALPVGQKLFSIQRDTVKYIPRDFTTYANILVKTGDKAKALEEYKKAIELDPTNIELPKEVATMCADEGLNAEAAEFYKKYIELAGENVQPTDYYQVGRYYYLAGTGALRADSTTATIEELPAIHEKGKANLISADSAFAKMEELMPESYLGSLWRARSNASLDPETEKGLAKPFYEETIKRILAKDDHQNDRELSEAYRYLAYFYYVQFDKTKKAEDKANAILNAEKLLEVDPTNQTGTQLLEFLRQ